MSESIEGWDRETLLTDILSQEPMWLAETEALHGPLVRHHALNLPDGRAIHLTLFAKAWRWTLQNPANSAGHQEVDIWLTHEALEATILLATLCKQAIGEAPEAFYGHLETYIAHQDSFHMDPDPATGEAP